MLDWTALILIDIEDNNMQCSRKILDEFLQLSYIQKLLQNYQESSDESSEEKEPIYNRKVSESSLEKNKFHVQKIEEHLQINEHIEIKEHEHIKKIVKYLKKLNAKSSEFYPKSKKFNTHSEPFLVKKKEESKKEEKKEETKVKKLKVKNDIEEFIPAARKLSNK